MLSLAALDALWLEWKRSDMVLRFGQFVLNKFPSVTDPSIYYEQDNLKAYDKLRDARTIFPEGEEETA
ncbi:hypothetical protein [Microcystis phage Mwe-JY26]